MEEFYMEMEAYSLVHSALSYYFACAEKHIAWREAETEEEAESAECAYYDCVDHFRLLKRVLQKRGLMNAYYRYCDFIAKEGLLNG